MNLVHHTKHFRIVLDMDNIILPKTGFGSDTDIIFQKQDRIG